MTTTRKLRLRLAAVAIAGWALLAAQESRAQLPLEPIRDSGQGVTGAFEELVSKRRRELHLARRLRNRNEKSTLDIPVGPNNRIDPGGPDMGQPTHFLLKRQWGVFTITVPKDFADKKLTWTLVVNGETSSVPLSLHPKWAVQPFKDPSVGNRRRSCGSKPTAHRSGTTTSRLRSRQPAPILTLTLWATDDQFRSSQSPEAGRATNHRFLEPGTRTGRRDFWNAKQTSTRRMKRQRLRRSVHRAGKSFVDRSMTSRGRWRWQPVLLD